MRDRKGPEQAGNGAGPGTGPRRCGFYQATRGLRPEKKAHDNETCKRLTNQPG